MKLPSNYSKISEAEKGKSSIVGSSPIPSGDIESKTDDGSEESDTTQRPNDEQPPVPNRGFRINSIIVDASRIFVLAASLAIAIWAFSSANSTTYLNLMVGTTSSVAGFTTLSGFLRRPLFQNQNANHRNGDIPERQAAQVLDNIQNQNANDRNPEDLEGQVSQGVNLPNNPNSLKNGVADASAIKLASNQQTKDMIK